MKRFVFALLIVALFTSPALAGMPTYVAAGTHSESTLPITPELPAGIQANDILLLYVQSFAGEDVTITDENGGTWTEIFENNGGTSGRRLTVFWSRYNGTQGSPTTNDPGSQAHGFIEAFRGVKATGNPYNTSSNNFDDDFGSTLTITGATTTAANCLVVIIATLNDDADDASGWTNANLTNITEHSDIVIDSTTDSRLFSVTGEKASAGAYGNTTATATSTSATNGTIALEGASSGGGTMGLLGVGR